MEPRDQDNKVVDRDQMLDELAYILLHGGRPPNWVAS